MALPEPLRRYLRLQRQYDERIFKILESSARDLQRRIAQLERLATTFSESVRLNQLRLALSQIRHEQLQMFLTIGDEIRAGQLAAATIAEADLERLARVAFASLPAKAADAFIDSLMATAEAGIKTFYARVPRELSARLYKNGVWSTQHIETLIQNGILRGASARELARDVYKFVSPTAPGGASYVSMRLARTEINNAFHNQQIAGFTGPWVEAVKWNLSGSHPRPDECNRLAQSDQYHLGPGMFPPGKVPGKPHPECLCFLTAVSVPPGEFAKQVKAGKFDDELRRRFDANVASLKGVPAAPVKKVVSKPTPVKVAPKKTAPAVKKATPTPAPKPKATQPRPVPEAAKPYHRSIKGIEDLADTVENSAITHVRPLTGGVSAETELVTFANGKQLVRKSAGNPGAEEAASMVGRSLGLKAPRVYRNHPGEVFMDYAGDAKTMAELEARLGSGPSGKLFRDAVDSDEGKVVGLFDTLIRNGDRNRGNWMLLDSNQKKIIPIDHGHARPFVLGGAGGRMAPIEAGGPFAEATFSRASGGQAFKFKGHPFTAEDIAEVRQRIRALKGDLIHFDHGDWAEYALAVLDRMEPHVTSKRNLIAGVRRNLMGVSDA